MDKIKLTQKQADAIGWLKLNDWSLEKWINEKSYLNDLTIDEMARVLYEPNSYEVVKEFNVGDWVISDSQVITDEVRGIDGAHVETYMYTTYHKSIFRHATPKEIAEEKQRRWWEKHGREVGEVKENDALKDCIEGDRFLVMYDYIIPKKEINNFIVMYFTEDRKDIHIV